MVRVLVSRQLWFVICFVAGGILYGMLSYMTWALCKTADRASSTSLRRHTLSPSHPSSRGSSLSKFDQLGGPVPGPPSRPASLARSHRSSRGSSPPRSDRLGPRAMFFADYPAAAYSSGWSQGYPAPYLHVACFEILRVLLWQQEKFTSLCCADFVFFNQSGERPWEFAPIPFGIIPSEPAIWNPSHDPGYHRGDIRAL